MSHFAEYASRFAPLIEADLRTALTPAPDMPPLFTRMLEYHMGWVDQDGKAVQASGGKHIRPMLCLLVCEATSDDHTAGRAPAAAMELIHDFSLLHDDIQDQSPLRRNRPTVWSIWGSKQAINTGDALFALAHLAVFRVAGPEVSEEAKLEMLRVIDQTALTLTRGQFLDISFESREDVTVDEYLDMIGAKTAALIRACAYLGALAGEAERGQLAHYEKFGENLGMAFQVIDDILDIWGDPSLTGKEAAHDVRQRKKSLPVVYGLEHDPELAALYQRSEPLDNSTVQHIVSRLEQAGARRYSEELAEAYSNETISQLEAASPSGSAGEALFELTHQLLKRDR